MNITAGQAFYQRQIALLEAHDIEGLVGQYHPEAIMQGFDFTAQGSAQIRARFQNYLAYLGKLKLKSTDKFAETPYSIFFEATILSGQGEARVYDVFILRDGKATQHFSGVIATAAA